MIKLMQQSMLKNPDPCEGKVRKILFLFPELLAQYKFLNIRFEKPDSHHNRYNSNEKPSILFVADIYFSELYQKHINDVEWCYASSAEEALQVLSIVFGDDRQ